LEDDPAVRAAVADGLVKGGHAVVALPYHRDSTNDLSRLDVVLFGAGASDDDALALAVGIERRGIKTMLLGRSTRHLDALRAKGLVCFRAPDGASAIVAAVQARL
jgi:hypothetical protein